MSRVKFWGKKRAFGRLRLSDVTRLLVKEEPFVGGTNGLQDDYNKDTNKKFYDTL
jgi:hypothetical protein